MISAIRFLYITVFFCFAMIAGGCAASFKKPDLFDDKNLRNRATTITKNDIRVSAAVPTREESIDMFGVDLEKKGFQPLWLEIRNNTDRRIRFMPTGMDPEYFSSREVSFAFHRWFSKNTNSQIDEYFESLRLKYLVEPHSTSTGFVFTNPDKDSKFITLDLIARKWTESFNFIVPTAFQGITEDGYGTLSSLVKSTKSVGVEEGSNLRELLEGLPCCSSNKGGMPGEPLNIVLIGEVEDILPAFRRRNYSYTSVASRYVFQRPQDVSASKLARRTREQPHILRTWLTKLRFQDKPVWIGQVTTPYGGRFARKTKDAPIDPFVDEARNDLVQDLIYSQFLVKMGFVKGAGSIMASNPEKLSGNATYHTDGLRAVLIFDDRPVSLDEIDFFDWERLASHYRKPSDIEKTEK